MKPSDASDTAERGHGLLTLARGLRPILPISLVTVLAMYGQVEYAFQRISPPTWPLAAGVALAVGIAVAVESIALYLQWHAHDALLAGHTLTAARQRRASYLLAAAVGAVNYSHFSNGWQPTPAAVCFALFSAAGPWLWGLHTRRAQRVQLAREGQLDTGGAVFRAERYRWFPIRTFMALRWSIDHGVTDPRLAWVGYNAERSDRRASRRPRQPTAPSAGPTGGEAPILWLEDEAAQLFKQDSPPDREPTEPDRTTFNDAEIVSDARQWAVDLRRPASRDEMLRRYRIGAPRCKRLRDQLGWPDGSTAVGKESTGE